VTTDQSGPSNAHRDNPTVDSASPIGGAVVFDLSHWTQLELAGVDRAKFLHNFCTNEIKKLATGQGCQAFVTTIQGKLLAHMFVYAGAKSLLLIGAPGIAERTLKHLSKYQISEDVAFRDLAAEQGLLLVVGPGAAVALAAIGCDVQGLADGEHREWSSEVVRVMRNDMLGLPGYLISAPSQQISEFRYALGDGGALLADSALFESLRIAAGFPLYGIDLSDANLAQEASLTKQAISFTKGCYLGQEPIARIDAMGHVNQQIRIVRLAEGGVPEVGTSVVSAEDESKVIGRITSAALSIDTGKPVALAMLKRNFDTPGLVVRVPVGGKMIPAEVDWPK
jgi:folate-binding protein YgfZ